ncbi:MAG: L-serine ammonia-lyase, iron-sulfur-dependent, subunit alpha [Erysipelotrichaceae bacterium]|jgi:L-serine dehydratase
MESLKELYRIGPGPSSSHTLAVRNACLLYMERYSGYPGYYVELCGSLGLTGKGHMSDKIVESVFGKEKVRIKFNPEVAYNYPNTMIFQALSSNVLSNKMVVYSTGGGAIEVEGEPPLVDKNVYPHKNLKEIMNFCQENNYNFAQYVFNFEPDIKPYLRKVLNQMLTTVRSGLKKDGILPGELKVVRVAKKLYNKAMDCEEANIKERLLISSYAYAAMEENASGEMVVTAPTLGSCGVLAAMMVHYFEKGISKEILVNALATAGVFGNIVKRNATISGAVGGCQAEIGTACSMAAAFAGYVEGLSNRKIEYAAEIAMEHNLGLTCDPVGGYVQVPCIERNGQAVLRSMDSMIYAKYLGEIRENIVTFDMIVEVMNYTGQKIAMELKETSLGGLAEVVPMYKKEFPGC